ncbi:MAG TPA: hypothetical protein VIL36_09760 [Acidimicrobiales bacterium]
MNRRKTTLAGLVGLALLLAGCGGDDGDSSDEADAAETAAEDEVSGDTDEDAGSDDTDDDAAGGTSSATGANVDVPCADLVSEDLLAQAFPEVPFREPLDLTGTRGINDVEWTANGCVWESDIMDLRVVRAGPEGFSDGFVCAEPIQVGDPDGPVPVDGLGDQAWWKWGETLNGPKGELAVCQGELRVDADVKAVGDFVTMDPEATQAGLRQIAEAFL